MFDLGWTEMMVIGIVALIVVGPKDLPGLFRSVGKFIGKAKGMAREFSSAMNAAADESGVSEINKTIKAAANPQKFGADKIREASGMGKFDPTSPKDDGKPETETDKLRAKMTDERKATAKKMSDAMAKSAEDRMAAEKAAAAKAEKAEAARLKRNEAARAKRAAAKAAKEAEAKDAT